MKNEQPNNEQPNNEPPNNNRLTTTAYGRKGEPRDMKNEVLHAVLVTVAATAAMPLLVSAFNHYLESQGWR